MSADELTCYARDLAAEIDEAIQNGERGVYTDEEFTRVVLEKLGEEGALDNPTLLYQEGTFGPTEYRITGFSIPETEDRLLLATTVHTGGVPPRELTTDEIHSAVTRAANFYRCSCDGLHTQLEPAKTEGSDLARRIFDLHDQIEVLRVVLISDGLTGLRSIDVRDAKDGTRILVDLYGIERLHRLLGEGLTRDDISLDIVAQTGEPLVCLKASPNDVDYDAYMTAIPAIVLADVYEKYGARLLELNVRAFLGVRGRRSVNGGLRQTIIEDPMRFLAYNNGIVATADEIEIVTDVNGKFSIRRLRGLQIVNGGQTTASLHRARRQDKVSLESIWVPAKIIRMKGENLDAMVAAVSRSANSQNAIQPADFSANDPFHVAVETLANITWLPDRSGCWFYERVRGSYGAAEYRASASAPGHRRFASETPKDRQFTKTDLAKYLNAWDGFPYLVSSGNQKNFQSFMQSLKDRQPDGFTPDEDWYKSLIAKAILFRTTQSIVRQRRFSAYQANIIAYTVACLSWKTGGRIDFDLIWSQQSISKELKNLIDTWVVEVDQQLRKTARSRTVSEWAKKVECWEVLRDVDFEFSDPLPAEMRAQSGRSPSGARIDGLSGEELNLIDRCRGINSATWFKVAQWGTKSKQIHWKVAGVAKTVGEYAIGGWEHSPTAKQAKWAMEAYKTAEEAGILPTDNAD